MGDVALTPSDTNPFIPRIEVLEVDPDGLGTVLQTAADEVEPAWLRPPVGPTHGHRMAVNRYLEELDKFEKPREPLDPWQEIQLETQLEEAHRLLASPASGPFEIYTLKGKDPEPRDMLLFCIWVALLNQTVVIAIQDEQKSDGSFVGKLMVYRKA